MSLNTRSVPLETISEVYLEMMQGDDEEYTMQIQVFNPVTEEFEDYDLSSVTEIDFSIKSKITGIILYNGQLGTGEIDITDAVSGTILVEVNEESTRVIPVAIHKYDVQITTAAGKKRTVLLGDMQVVDDVTI